MTGGDNGAGSVRLRKATVADVETLVRWDSDPAVAESGGDDDEFDWAAEVPRSVEWRDILIAEEDGRPVGVIVLIDAAREETHYWGDDVEPGAWAIDIWIGDAGDRGRGIGTQMMHEAVERCFAEHGASAVLIDPLASNPGAVRFYERFGFVHLGPRVFGDDACAVMRFERST